MVEEVMCHVNGQRIFDGTTAEVRNASDPPICSSKNSEQRRSKSVSSQRNDLPCCVVINSRASKL